MSAAQRRVFRIEMTHGGPRGEAASETVHCNGDDTLARARHREVMAALRDIRTHVGPAENLPDRAIDDFRHDLHEASKIKEEMDRIYEAINRTKRELATLHKSGFDGADISRMTDQLSAIVEGTEQATEAILHAAEEIDAKAGDLAAALKSKQNKDDVCDIQEQVIKIFEACNFQDLTGQRITKVVNAFCFIEDRVLRMMEIWGGIESFRDIEPIEAPQHAGDKTLLHGPALKGEDDVASQDDIDALFD